MVTSLLVAVVYDNFTLFDDFVIVIVIVQLCLPDISSSVLLIL